MNLTQMVREAGFDGAYCPRGFRPEIVMGIVDVERSTDHPDGIRVLYLDRKKDIRFLTPVMGGMQSALERFGYGGGLILPQDIAQVIADEGSDEIGLSVDQIVGIGYQHIHTLGGGRKTDPKYCVVVGVYIVDVSKLAVQPSSDWDDDVRPPTLRWSTLSHTDASHSKSEYLREHFMRDYPMVQRMRSRIDDA